MDRSIINHRVGRTCKVSPVLEVFRHVSLIGPACSLGITVLRYFFNPQYRTKLHPKRRPVAKVDHPLDRTVPFRPDLVAEYLTFFFLLINSAFYITRRYGKEGVKCFKRVIGSADRLYHDCGSIYIRCQSTTDRPVKAANGFFNIIHSFDPHLHCVPSLHVLVVVGNWLETNRSLQRLTDLDQDASARSILAYTRQEAVRIVETVLFVKQHSINCVGASLMYLTVNYPEFDRAAANDFVRELFTYESLDNAQEVREAILELYGRLLAEFEAEPGRGWKPCVMRFLDSFPKLPPYGVAEVELVSEDCPVEA
jgi:hypothetical protein